MRVFEPAERQENTPVGQKTVKYFKPRRKTDGSDDEDTLTIPGYAQTWKAGPAGMGRNDADLAGSGEYYRISGPYDADFVRLYVQQNHDADLIRRHLLLVADTAAELRAMIRDHEQGRSGMAPLIPSKIDRQGRAEHLDDRIRILGGPSAIGTADEQKNL
jgi:hypothetical protein